MLGFKLVKGTQDGQEWTSKADVNFNFFLE